MSVNRKRSLIDDGNTSSPTKKLKIGLYLEDYTPIRTVEVYNLDNEPHYQTNNEYKAFFDGIFRREGPVENVEIVERSGKDNERRAYVTFVLAEDAVKVIEQPPPKFIVLAADPSRQSKIDPNARNLEEINEYCLLLIMSKLTLTDVINLGKASTRMQAVSRLFYVKYSKFSYGASPGDSSINETNLPNILEAIGKEILSIEWHHLGKEQLDLLGKYCPNVTKLKLLSPKRSLSTCALKRNKAFFAKLKRLQIESSSLCDANMKIMMSGRQLKTLDLFRCHLVSGKFLNSLNRSKLNNIRIIECDQMRNFSCDQWKNQMIKFAYDKCCSYIVCLHLPPESLAKIKELQLDFSCFEGNMEDLHFDALKKLKQFTITRKNSEAAVNFNNIIRALSPINTLESLSIEGISIDSETINILRSMSKLKKLRLSKIVNTIGRKFYEDITVRLSTLNELSISSVQEEKVNGKLFNDIIAAIPNLSYFSHSSVTWELLNSILKAYQPSKKNSTLMIGVPKAIFDDPRKAAFDVASNGAIQLTVSE